MKKIATIFVRVGLAIGAGYMTFFVLVKVLEGLSDSLREHPTAKHAVESVLVFFAPVTFGLLILLLLVIGFYILLPKWIPWLRSQGSAG